MKLACLILLASVVASAQTLPTNGLVAQYDMLTSGGGGTTLTDLSGNGNNGTITGTTTNSFGRVCNGSSDFISMPQLIGNSDFTAIAISGGLNGYNTSTGGAAWGESNATASQFVRFGLTATTWTQLSGSTTTTNLPNTITARLPDWDVFFATRSQNQISGGILSRTNQIQSALNVNIGSVTVTGGGAALCALNEGSTRVNFAAITLAYFVLYNRHLNTTELQSAYNAMAAAVKARSIFIHPWPPSVLPAFSTPVWRRQGIVFSQQSAGLNTNEPMVLYDSTCPLLSIGICFRLWYSANNGTGIGYAESADGLAWTNNGAAGTTIIGGSVIQPTVLKVNGIYHLYGSSHTNTQIDHYTSPDGLHSWTLADNAVIGLGSAGAWDDHLIANAYVVFSPDGTGTWYMLYGGQSSGSGIWSAQFRTGGATSVDGHTWTKASANPFIGISDAFLSHPAVSNTACCGNPTIFFLNGIWWDWDGSYDIVRFANTTFNGSWIWSQYHASIRGTPPDETNQISDPSLVQAPCPSNIGTGTCSYIYYNAYSTNSAAAGVIKLAIAPMSLAQLVTTSEGATTDWP